MDNETLVLDGIDLVPEIMRMADGEKRPAPPVGCRVAHRRINAP